MRMTNILPTLLLSSFLSMSPTFTKGKKEVSGMWEQLEIAAQYQYYWADNSVSVTVTFGVDEEATDQECARAI